MDLGEKLLYARQEAGLSQRQLCGDVITRNMLSQIEHGTARPSMDTLRYLAERLGKPVSWFLEEDVVLSPNQALMEQVRKQCASGKLQDAWVLLQGFRHPDPVLEWEWNYRSFVCALAVAAQAKKGGKIRYARQLLEDAEQFEKDFPGLRRQRLLELAALPGTDLPEIVALLPTLDEELLLRAAGALAEDNTERAAALLEAVEDHTTSHWQYLRGRYFFVRSSYAAAAEHLQQAQAKFPEQCNPLLEVCFRELGDYKQAYEYACRQREHEK